jgi:OPA family glycerol-3-phosphate transporter-like MFS transporter
MSILNILRPAPDAKYKIAPDKQKKSYLLNQTKVLLTTSIGYIGYYIIRLIFTTQQKELMEAYHITKSDIGLVLACFGIGYGISKFFMGILSDKSNPRFYLALGLIISAILNLFLGSTSSVPVMMFLMVLMSVAQGMGAPASQKLIQFWWSKKNKATAFAVWSSAHNFGAFCCVSTISLAGVLVPSWGLQGTFYMGSIVSTIIAVFIIIFGVDRPSSVGLPAVSKFAGEVQVLQSGEVVTDDKTNLNLLQIFLKYILKNKIVWAVTLVSMSLYLVRYGILSWIPSYLVEDKGFDAGWAKWLVGIFELCAVPGVIILAVASDKIAKSRRVPICLFAVVLLVISFAGYSFLENHTYIVVCLIVMGTCIYAPLTLVGLMVNEAVPKFAVGSSTGFMGFFQYVVGEVLATALIGILVDIFGWKAEITVIGSAILLALLILIYLLAQEKSQRIKELKVQKNYVA